MARKKKSEQKRPKIPRLIFGIFLAAVVGPVLIFAVAPMLEPMEDTNPVQLAGVVFVFFGIGTGITAFFKRDDFWDG